MVLAVVLVIYSALPHRTIAQDEIDTEARHLIIEHGDGAIEAAEMSVQRSQWAKGNDDSMERSARVLKAVRKLVG